MAGTIINTASISQWGTLPTDIVQGQLLFNTGYGAIKMRTSDQTTGISDDANWATLSQLSGWGNDNTGTFFNNNGNLALTDAISYKIGTNTIDNIVLNVPLYNSKNTNLEFGTSNDFCQMHLGYWQSPGGSPNYRNISIIRGTNIYGGGTQSVLIQTYNGSTDAYVPHGMKFQGDTVYPIASISLGSSDERFNNIYATNLDLSNTLTVNGEISLAKHTNANNYRIKVNNNGIILQTFKNIDSSYKSCGIQFYEDTIYPYYNESGRPSGSEANNLSNNEIINLGASNTRFKYLYVKNINASDDVTADKFIGSLYVSRNNISDETSSAFGTAMISSYFDVNSNNSNMSTLALRSLSKNSILAKGILIHNGYVLPLEGANMGSIGKADRCFENIFVNNINATNASFSGQLSFTDQGSITLPDSSFTASGLNNAINALSIGNEAPDDNDYFISQYVGGGAETKTYHRRPISKLWNYVDQKLKTGSVNFIQYKADNLIGTSDAGKITLQAVRRNVSGVIQRHLEVIPSGQNQNTLEDVSFGLSLNYFTQRNSTTGVPEDSSGQNIIKPVSFGLHIGSSHIRYGLYDYIKNDWVLRSVSSNQTTETARKWYLKAARIEGDDSLTISSDLIVTDTTTLNDNLTVAEGKTTTLGGTLTVTSTATLNGNLTVVGTGTLSKIGTSDYYRIIANSNNGVILQTVSNNDRYGLQFYGSTIYPYYNGYRDNNANKKVNLGSSSNRFNTIYVDSANVNTLTVNTTINLPDSSVSTTKLTGTINGNQIGDGQIANNHLYFVNGTGASVTDFKDSMEFISSSNSSGNGNLLESNLHRRTFGQLYNYFQKKDREITNSTSINWSDFAVKPASPSGYCYQNNSSSTPLDLTSDSDFAKISPQSFSAFMTNNGKHIHVRISWTEKYFSAEYGNYANDLKGLSFFNIRSRYLPKSYIPGVSEYYPIYGSVKYGVQTGAITGFVSSSGYVLIGLPISSNWQLSNLEISFDYDLN